MGKIILLPILVPFVVSLVVLLAPKKLRSMASVLALIATLVNLAVGLFLFKKSFNFILPWLGYGIDFSLRLDNFSSFILAAVAGFSFLIALYSTAFMKGKENVKQFYAYLLISLAFVNGAVLANNLIVLLFFWEGLLLTLFGMIAIGSKTAYHTAIKAFIIVGISDLCMMIGIALTAYHAQTLTISNISLNLSGGTIAAFIFLMIGAISKAGSMPFHSWIPDAAVDAPLPFMSFMPAALEKLLGIYFLGRISFEMFRLTPESWLSPFMMTIGSITIILAVMMALVQKDYKRLLSYHAISQVGYMILGIGTALPIGIVGGLFHMINHAMYKSCLFLTGGCVEKQTGTTDLQKLGGLASKMPITLFCFVVAAASISGVPPFNGFFSKELIYDAALERNFIFYLCAIVGSFFTAASFLKLGAAAYFDKSRMDNKNVKEAPLSMLLPAIVIALGCIFFGLFRSWPLNNLIQPILGAKLEGHNFAAGPLSVKLVVITVVVLVLAILNHLFASKIKGSGLKAADYIYEAPVLHKIYDKAQKRHFDPYDRGLDVMGALSRLSWWLDRGLDWIYNNLVTGIVAFFSRSLRHVHNGNYAAYLGWSVVGMIMVVIFIVVAK